MKKIKLFKKLIFVGAFFVLSLILLLTNALSGLNESIMDLYQEKMGTNPDIKIIAIDDKSLSKLGPINTWKRDYYATMLNNLTSKSAPDVIGIDVIFTGSGDATSDEALVNACKDKNVVTGMELVYGDIVSDKTVTKNQIKAISYPYEELKAVTSQGYVNGLQYSSDGLVRRLSASVSNNGIKANSFGYEIYKNYCNKNNLSINEYSANARYRFKYSGDVGEFSHISFVDIYEGNILPEDLDGSIVLVGYYATGLDDFLTPINKSTKMNGVEIHANIINAFINDYTFSEVNDILLIVMELIIVVLISILILNVPIVVSGIGALIVIIASFLIECFGYKYNLFMPLNDLAIFTLTIYIVGIVVYYIEERRKKLKTINLFKKYVAPTVVDSALKASDYKVELGGQKRMIACLFVDIRGFTPLSEGLDPKDVVLILNEYLSHTTKCIFDNEGTLDKFIGDATMAIFNAPFDLDDYEFKAIKCALDIASGSKRIEDMFMEKYGKKVSYGIGVNVGEAVVGNIGSETRMDYTAIGDTVNTAARLEANAKAGEILISEWLYERVKDRFNVELVGPLTLKGKSKPVITYRVLGLKE